jgi:hypothetical protein
MITPELVATVIETQGVTAGLCLLILFINYRQTKEIMCMKNTLLCSLIDSRK